jgi:TonB family protein
MKNIAEFIDNSSPRENQSLTFLLCIGLMGSACVHAAALVAPLPSLWKTDNVAKSEKAALEDTIAIIFEANQDMEPPIVKEVPVMEKATVVTVRELEPISEDYQTINSHVLDPVRENIATIQAAPTAIALEPKTTNTPTAGKDVAAPDTYPTLLTQNISDTQIPQGGAIMAKSGNRSGLSNAKNNGNPDGKIDGFIDIGSTDRQNRQEQQGILTSALSTAPIIPIEQRSPKLECLSCPKPQYRGKEGTPRVTYDIAPDGRVINIRLRQSSGDAQTDRETLEAMSRWQFNPQTVPEGGRTNVRMRVTFEEEGSQFQRQNEERRREAERLAEQERQQRESARSPVVVNTSLEVESIPDSMAEIKTEPLAAPLEDTAPHIVNDIQDTPKEDIKDNANPQEPTAPLPSPKTHEFKVA